MDEFLDSAPVAARRWEPAYKNELFNQAAIAVLFDWLIPFKSNLPELSMVDLLIATAIWNANTRHVYANFELLDNFCLEGVFVPEEEMRGASCNTISQFLNVPFETVRRRTRRMSSMGFLSKRAAGLFAVGLRNALFFELPALELTNARSLARHYGRLAAAELPAANWIRLFDDEEATQLRRQFARIAYRSTFDFAMLFLSNRLHDLTLRTLAKLTAPIVG